MRSLELHACAKQVKRSAGRSSVAAAAYRAGDSLTDERTGLVHDYTRKGGVEHAHIYAPEYAPAWAYDRHRLWNAVEKKENRKNSATAHELEIGFPAEFNAQQRREAGETIALELVRRYQCAVDIAYHAPNKSGDQRNHHAHILFTTRGFDASRPDGWAKGKFRDLSQDQAKDENNNPVIDEQGKKQTVGQLEILDLRRFISAEMNRIALRENLPVTIEHLSFEKRGIDRIPTEKMGYVATQFDRAGKSSERGKINTNIRAANDDRAALKNKVNILSMELARLERGSQPALKQTFTHKVAANPYAPANDNKNEKTLKQKYRQQAEGRYNVNMHRARIEARRFAERHYQAGVSKSQKKWDIEKSKRELKAAETHYKTMSRSFNRLLKYDSFIKAQTKLFNKKAGLEEDKRLLQRDIDHHRAQREKLIDKVEHRFKRELKVKKPQPKQTAPQPTPAFNTKAAKTSQPAKLIDTFPKPPPATKDQVKQPPPIKQDFTTGSGAPASQQVSDHKAALQTQRAKSPEPPPPAQNQPSQGQSATDAFKQAMKDKQETGLSKTNKPISPIRPPDRER